MNRHQLPSTASLYAALLLATVLSAAPLHAQQAAKGTAAPETQTPARRVPVVEESTKPADLDAKKEEDLLHLSPFLVQESANDSRYFSENTLAGSRLNSNIGDLAASITVVTRQQMLDTAAIDMNDVFLYEANTEGTGNYTAFTFNDQGGVTDSTSVSPSTANRVRGIGPPDKANNYYLSIASLPFDVYNTESVEINRGPNSLLFGLGSAAGIVNQSSSQANLRKNSYELSARYGSHDAYRGSFRFNQALIPGKLAIFVAGLYDSRGFTLKPSYDISRRGYMAISYSPLKNTTIRANYERFTNNMQRPNSITPQDGISEWRAAGSPTWDPLTFTYTRNGVATANGSSNVAALPGIQTGTVSLPSMYYDQGVPVLWMVGGLSTGGITGALPNTAPIMMQSSTDIAKRANNLPLYRNIGITDKSLYDWTSLNLTTGNLSNRQANVYNVEVDQRIFNNLYGQAGWYRQDYRQYQAGYNAPGMIVVDINTRLVDGTVNPYLGRPFFQYANGADSVSQTINDNYRGSLAYQLDFTKHGGWSRFLGKHQFFAIGNTRKVESTNYASNEVITSGASWQNLAARYSGASGQTPAATNISPKIYVGGPDGLVTQAPGQVVHGPLDIALRRAIPNGDGTYTWVNDPTHLDLALSGNTNRSYQMTDSITLGMQSSFWDNRIVPTVGWRRDKNVGKANKSVVVDPSTGYVNLANLSVWNPSQVTFGNTSTLGVVVKPLSWISFTYNQSENFTPAPLRYDIGGSPLPLPAGEGKDYGVRFTMFDNKLTFGLNYFTGGAARARGTQADSFMFRVARVESAFITWATGVAQTRLGAGASTSAVNTEVARITGLPVGYVPPALGSIGSTSTVEAKGTEFSLIYNPVKNFNIKGTFGTQKTLYSDIAPEFNSYVDPRLPTYMTAVDTLGVRWWDYTNAFDLGSPSGFWSQNVDNPIKLAKALEGKRTQGQRQWSGSIIATYRFLSGPLKGFEIGGSGRFQDKAVIGYYGKPAGADGIVRELDPNRPIFDNPRPAADLWVTKNFTLPKFLGRDLRAKVQLNIRNMFEDEPRLEAIAVNPDGKPNTFRILDAREIYLTTTLSF
jgi:outer membrane receptor protein involved in Fe transport